MSAYNPPIRNLTIFDTLLFREAQSDASGDLDLRYLKFPTAQGTENLQGVNVAGVATFNNTATFNGAATFNNDVRLNQTKIHLGTNSGLTSQGDSAIAIGSLAASATQGIEAVAIGANAGQTNQGREAVALGTSAASISQGAQAVAIGRAAAVDTQGAQAVAIGWNAGSSTQGAGAIAIGYNAATTGQNANSIQINATGTTISQPAASSCVVAPIRTGSANTTQRQLYYDTTTSEVFSVLPVASSVLGGELAQQAITSPNAWIAPTSFPSISLPSAGVYIITYAISCLPSGGNVLMGCLSTASTAPYTSPQTTAVSSNLLAFSGTTTGNNNWISATNTIIYTASAAIPIYLYMAVSANATIRGGAGDGSYFRAIRIA